MGNEKPYRLLEKRREGKCTPEELAELDAWYEELSADADRIDPVPHEKLGQLFYGIAFRINAGRRRRKSSSAPAWIGVGIAAAIIAAVFILPHLTPGGDTVDNLPSVGDTWRAELITGGGDRLPLDATPAIEEDGVLIARNSDLGLDYSEADETGSIAGGAHVYHTIIVPLGCEYGVTLSDGSRVMLNSGSELTYPVSFGSDKREVVLRGEGYFDVCASPVPFIVNASPVMVRVVGTSFNVAAYDDDDDITTTLVSGSVSIRIGGEREQSLTPGNQLAYGKADQSVMLRACDTDLATSWTRGEFKFRDMPLCEILKRLGRWYGYDVRFEDAAMKYQRFSGAAEKNRPLEYVLDIMEHVTDIKLSLIDNTIVVGKVGK